MKPTALLYVAHQINEDVVEGWTHLCDTAVGPGSRAVFLYDNSRRDFVPVGALQSADVYLFTYSDLAQRFPIHTYDPARPLDQGNATLAMLAFWRDRPEFATYWRIEYDVLLDGPWWAFLNSWSGNDADLLTTTLSRPEVQPNWAWWNTLVAPWSTWGEPRPIRSFMPIARFSSRAFDLLDRAYTCGWRGHDEVLIPTSLGAAGLSIEDLGGNGEFVRRGNTNRYYANTPSRQGLAPGTFVCPPQHVSIVAYPGMLYHPVKKRAVWAENASSFRATQAIDLGAQG